MIHTCINRLWYVNEYLVKSLREQGFTKDEIKIYLDKESKGNLKAFMDSISQLPDEGHTWHLQDDVILCRDFRERALQYDDFDGIVAGFMSIYDVNDKKYHNIPNDDMRNLGWTFPCIKIPNSVAKLCLEMYNIVKNDATLEYWKQLNKGDDAVFKLYLEKYQPKIMHINAVPNLVDHIDYLLGGSTVNKSRAGTCRALYFEDLDLVKKLESELYGRV